MATFVHVHWTNGEDYQIIEWDQTISDEKEKEKSLFAQRLWKLKKFYSKKREQIRQPEKLIHVTLKSSSRQHLANVELFTRGVKEKK